MIREVVSLLVVFAVFLPVSVRAQLPESVSPGAVQKSLEGRKSVSPGLQKEIPLELPRHEKGGKRIQKGVKILVRRFEFKGNKVLSGSYLEGIVKGYLNRELSFSDLEEVCRKIEAVYREKGYFLAQAIIPPQEVKGGVVVIKVLEGRLGKVEVEGERHYKERFIKGHFKPTESGVINYHRLLKTLLLLNEHPDLKVHATLKRGEAPGTTDILLKVQDRWPVHFYLDYNDFGTRYVSRHRFGSALECSNVLLQGDTFKFRGVVGSPIKQLQFVKFEYTFPLGTSDTKLGIHYTYLTYKVGREFRVLDLRGKSKIFTVDLIRPVVRTRRSILDVGVAFDYKQIRDYLLGQVTSDDELRIVRALARYSHLDRLRGRNQIYLEWSWGIPYILAGSKRVDPRASRLGAGGSFLKAELQLQRVQWLPFGTYLVLRGGGQLSWNDLPISEQYSIGGADSVRGFESSAYLGDSGYSGSIEWYVPPPIIGNWKSPFLKGEKIKQAIKLVGFFDYGRIFLRDPQPGEYKNVGIAGVGCGLRMELPLGFECRVDVGFPVGGVRPRKGSANGEKYRIYLQVSKKVF